MFEHVLLDNWGKICKNTGFSARFKTKSKDIVILWHSSHLFLNNLLLANCIMKVDDIAYEGAWRWMMAYEG